MLSYQHAYHAGCLADVHKHAALALLLQELTRQPPRMTYVETHSGRGLYRLDSAEAKKTGEAQAGIVRLLAENALPADWPFTRLLRQVRARHGRNAYPGSPLIAQMLLRPEDRLHLFELHPAEHAALLRNLKGRNLRIGKEDGYRGALRLRPPSPPKGLVMVDPSFEVKAEYLQAAEFVRKQLRAWPEAVVLLWYPLLKAGHHEAMVEAMDEAGLPGYWHQQVRFCKPEEVRGMHGSGLFAVNLPTAVRPGLEALSAVFDRIRG